MEGRNSGENDDILALGGVFSLISLIVVGSASCRFYLRHLHRFTSSVQKETSSSPELLWDVGICSTGRIDMMFKRKQRLCDDSSSGSGS